MSELLFGMMSEDTDTDDKNVVSKRGLITHLGAVISGWFLGSFLDPLKRRINELISETRFGREANVNFGYAESQEFGEGGYTLQITNSGEETAENLSFYLGFKEQITAAAAEDWINIPPAPETNIEITDGGVARVKVDFVRRNIDEHGKPLMIHFGIEEGTRSDHAHRIDKDEKMFIAYRYSWTFLGERYYESTDHHITRKE